MYPEPACGPQFGGIPPKVQAAQQFLHFINSVRNQCGIFSMPGDAPVAERDLSSKEQSTYEAALNVMQMYFLGEEDYEPLPPKMTPPGPGGDDPPRNPVPAH